jgi:hypothetical protein
MPAFTAKFLKISSRHKRVYRPAADAQYGSDALTVATKLISKREGIPGVNTVRDAQFWCERRQSDELLRYPANSRPKESPSEASHAAEKGRTEQPVRRMRPYSWLQAGAPGCTRTLKSYMHAGQQALIQSS